MEHLTKTTELYRKHEKEKIRCCKDVKVSMQVARGFSEYNRDFHKIIISSCAIYLDQLLIDKMYNAWVGEPDKLMLESGSSILVTDGNSVRTYGKPDNDTIMIADILWEMEYGGNTEMGNLFKKFCKSKIPFSKEDVAQFCDSYATHNVSKNSMLSVNNTLTYEEAEASVRSGLMKKAPILSLVQDLQESMFTNTRPVKGTAPAQEMDEPLEYLERAKQGEFIIMPETGWDEEIRQYIRPLTDLEGYVPSVTFVKLVKKITFRARRIMSRMSTPYTGFDDIRRTMDIQNDAVNGGLTGPPGVGKSYDLQMAAVATGMPCLFENLSHNTDEDQFTGLVRIVNGTPVSVPTATCLAFRHGGVLVWEEANLVQPAVAMGAVGQAIEKPYILKENGYQITRRHPLCMVFITSNVDVAGTKEFAPQFLNRFHAGYMIEESAKSVFIKMMASTTEAPSDLCEWVYDRYIQLVDYIRTEQAAYDTDPVLRALSIRTCFGAIENIQEGSDPKTAICDSIIGIIGHQNPSIARNCKAVLSGFKEYKEKKEKKGARYANS